MFQSLAEKAPQLSSDVVIAGWLHRAALFEAASLHRAKAIQIRKMNEAANEAHAEDVNTCLDPNAWAELTPIIDTALNELPPHDRDVVPLRFCQGLTYREIGSRLVTRPVIDA